MKALRKWLSGALALATALTLLAACGGGKPAETAAANTGEATTVPEETEPQYITANLPEKNFNGKTFNFFGRIYEGVWSATDIATHDETGEMLNDAVYARTVNMEEKYNVKLVATEGGANVILTDMKTIVTSGDNTYQAMVSDVYDAGGLAVEGGNYDLNKVKNIDLSQRWWSKKANDTMTIANTQFYATGEIFIVDNRATRVFFFNKEIVKDLKLESPYTLVKNNKWDVDKYFEYSEKAMQDLNGDGQMERGKDQFGTMCQTTLGEVLLFAAGKNITAKDKNDIPYISCLDDATMSVMTKLTERISSAKSVSMSGDQIITTAYPDNVYYFANGQALFAPEVLVHIESMRDVDIDIGIIPPPKYTADQNGYYCYADGWCVNVVLIPKSNPEPDDIGFILEAMSADSMNNLTPAYYDVCLTNKFVRDKESVEMLDLIFANVVMDNANIFSWGSLESTMNSAFANGDIASSIQSVKSATESAITKTVEAFQKNSK